MHREEVRHGDMKYPTSAQFLPHARRTYIWGNILNLGYRAAGGRLWVVSPPESTTTHVLASYRRRFCRFAHENRASNFSAHPPSAPLSLPLWTLADLHTCRRVGSTPSLSPFVAVSAYRDGARRAGHTHAMMGRPFSLQRMHAYHNKAAATFRLSGGSCARICLDEAWFTSKNVHSSLHSYWTVCRIGYSSSRQLKSESLRI